MDPLAPVAVSPLASESSLPSALPPVWIRDSTDIRFEITALGPLASTDVAALELEVVEAEGEAVAVVAPAEVAWAAAAL